MYILIILNFICICCVGVFLFIQLKEKEDEIEELYDLYYSHIEKDKEIREKERIIRRYDKRIF